MPWSPPQQSVMAKFHPCAPFPLYDVANMVHHFSRTSKMKLRVQHGEHKDWAQRPHDTTRKQRETQRRNGKSTQVKNSRRHEAEQATCIASLGEDLALQPHEAWGARSPWRLAPALLSNSTKYDPTIPSYLKLTTREPRSCHVWTVSEMCKPAK